MGKAAASAAKEPAATLTDGAAAAPADAVKTSWPPEIARPLPAPLSAAIAGDDQQLERVLRGKVGVDAAALRAFVQQRSTG